VECLQSENPKSEMLQNPKLVDCRYFGIVLKYFLHVWIRIAQPVHINTMGQIMSPWGKNSKQHSLKACSNLDSLCEKF
jgi:hypothetical protein